MLRWHVKKKRILIVLINHILLSSPHRADAEQRGNQVPLIPQRVGRD